LLAQNVKVAFGLRQKRFIKMLSSVSDKSLQLNEEVFAPQACAGFFLVSSTFFALGLKFAPRCDKMGIWRKKI
jgi:hypothetical protein